MTTEDKAAQESGLEAEYQHDEKLLNFYKRKLLLRSWAGSRTATEKRYCALVWQAKHGADSSALPLAHEGTDTPTGENE